MATRTPLRTLPIISEDGNQVGTEGSVRFDVRALEADLRKAVRGEITFAPGSRSMYSHDASNYRMTPIGVVSPLDEEDVVETVAVARKHGVPIMARGGGTSIAGQVVNVALLIDFSRHMNKVLSIDPVHRIAKVQPGVVLDDLRDAAKSSGLTFGPDPATHSRCTLGGMIGNNSCGVHSVVAGRTSDNVEALDVLTYDGVRMKVGSVSEEMAAVLEGRRGEIHRALIALRDKYAGQIRERFPKIPRRVSGYNLDDLLPEKGFNVARALVGSEGTCALILCADVSLIPLPDHRVMLVLGFPDQPSAGRFVPTCLKFRPLGCEGFDAAFFEKMRMKGMEAKHIDLLPEGRTWLLVEFGGESVEEAAAKARELESAAKGMATSNLLVDARQRHIWELREAGLGATAHVPGLKENWEGWEDTAVSPERLGEYLADFQSLMEKFGYTGSFYGHYGDGCVHVRIDFDLRTAAGIVQYRKFVEEGADLVRRYGGSLTGEHGDGQARAELLSRMFGDELIQAFAEFKSIWDPQWRMNPGKVIAPYKLDENLTLGAGYQVPKLATHFQFPHDKGSFGEAAMRCVGAGVCRRKSGGVMCPSYKVTLEEQHSTRGRARLLDEMVRGEVITQGWRSKEVKEALDLCLGCKGCKSDCPVQVDVATYKAEFLSHHYAGRLRPLRSYFFGHIHFWARLASTWPWLANGTSGALKPLLRVADDRRLPSFRRPFTRGGRSRTIGDGKRVLLWPDTFNDHFHPETLEAAWQVLETAGFCVELPKRDLCCGRPLYDQGLLAAAKRHLLKTIQTLAHEIEEGTPIVVLEPSCAAVFRDEMLNLFPGDARAIKLASLTLTLAEFLEREAPDFKPPKRRGKAVVHVHCHQRAVLGADSFNRLMEATGLSVTTPEAGCCGMAGAFGFEKGRKNEVAVACGESALAPAVRAAEDDTLIVADGFSCREQIRQMTGREPLHSAELLNQPGSDLS